MLTAKQAAASWQRNAGRSLANYVTAAGAAHPIEAMRERYVRDEISLEAFEARIEALLRTETTAGAIVK